MSEPRLGVSGRLARAFQTNPLTPVLALAALLLGLVAVMITPREEEPQIDVTMANVFVPFPGSSAHDVESLVSVPLQQKLAEVEGVKHVYAMSRPGMAVVTVEFDVGIPRKDALVRLYNQVFANADFVPPGLGVGPPLVRPMGIDDVPVMGVTLWTDDPGAVRPSSAPWPVRWKPNSSACPARATSPRSARPSARWSSNWMPRVSPRTA